MATRFWRKISLLIGMLGLLGHSGVRADEVNSAAFQSEEEARAYLDKNPFGPQAKAAFLALVEFDLARKNPGFSLEEIRSGFAELQSYEAATSAAAPQPTDAVTVANDAPY